MIDLQNTFSNFSAKKIVVIGDVMIDTYLNGSVNRISPEAPVPVVKFASKENRLGGAANVAMNIKALGAEPIICSVIGDDEEGKLFLDLLKSNGLTDKGIFESKNHITTVKTRIIGNNQQLLRIDQEEIKPIHIDLAKYLITQIKEICNVHKPDAIIFEDYNKGLLVPELIHEIIKFANEKNILTAVDPKKDNFFEYKNVTLFKPNLKELREGTNIDFNVKDKEQFLKAVAYLNNKLNPKHTFVTLSEHGVYINDSDENCFIPAHFRLIADVSGAGDTVIAVVTLCMASGLSPKLSAEIANLAGGLVCEKVGVVSIDKEQLMNEALKLL